MRGMVVPAVTVQGWADTEKIESDNLNRLWNRPLKRIWKALKTLP